MASNKTLFLSGGAGYLGKCTAAALVDKGYDVILLDNYSTSPRPAKPLFPSVEVDLTDREALRKVWRDLPKPAGVLHFAARALVPESVADPALYFRNNVTCATNLAELASESPGCAFVHSSSCAVYGIPKALPLVESSALSPVSPYGESKRMVEQLLEQFRRWKQLSVLNLRYFNPSGAVLWKGHWLGEVHEPETHLIPTVIRAGLKGETVPVYGDQFQTPDGSCLRDFFHVADLAEAHFAALEYLWGTPAEKRLPAINIGSGRGTSVLNVIEAAEKTLGVKISTLRKPARDGDPGELVADTTLATSLLKWTPRFGLAEILRSHSEFLKKSSRS